MNWVWCETKWKLNNIERTLFRFIYLHILSFMFLLFLSIFFSILVNCFFIAWPEEERKKIYCYFGDTFLFHFIVFYWLRNFLCWSIGAYCFYLVKIYQWFYFLNAHYFFSAFQSIFSSPFYCYWYFVPFFCFV